MFPELLGVALVFREIIGALSETESEADTLFYGAFAMGVVASHRCKTEDK